MLIYDKRAGKFYPNAKNWPRVDVQRKTKEMSVLACADRKYIKSQVFFSVQF